MAMPKVLIIDFTIAGTPFMVDGFKFQSPKCKHYFLTHYHADHTIGASQQLLHNITNTLIPASALEIAVAWKF
jgi:L-ascorbate metabolism protein UlaG (beta-lactamase superfamily)